MYVKVTKGVPSPYTLDQLKADNPQVSFPEKIPEKTLNNYGVHTVVKTTAPVVTAGQALTKTVEMIGGAWTQAHTVTTLDPVLVADDNTLTARQFSHMSALAGYDDAIDSILALLKTSNRALYAEIKAGAQASKEYHFTNVLAIISNPVVAPLIPTGVDVTRKTLAANWLAAKDY